MTPNFLPHPGLSPPPPGQAEVPGARWGKGGDFQKGPPSGGRDAHVPMKPFPRKWGQEGRVGSGQFWMSLKV